MTNVKPEYKRAAHAYIDRALERERAYITNIVFNAAMLGLCGEHDFRKKRIARIAGYVYANLEELFSHPPYAWLDIIEVRCRELGLPIDEDNRRLRDRDGIKPSIPQVLFQKEYRQNKALREYTDFHRRIEGSYLANVIVTVCAFALREHFGFSVSKTVAFANMSTDVVTGYFDDDANVWPDRVENDLKSFGIVFDGYWIVPDTGNMLKWNAEQIAYQEINRRVLTQDAQKPKIGTKRRWIR